MDTQMMINVAIGATLAVAGWLARTLWEAVQKLQSDIHDIEIDLPRNYVRRDEFTDNMKEIKDMLSKIFDRLDNKMDKH